MAVAGAQETTASVVFLSMYQPRTPNTIKQQCQRPRRVHLDALLYVLLIWGKGKCGETDQGGSGSVYIPPWSSYL
jgi:hypothetical protein